MNPELALRIGTAGWSIPRNSTPHAATEGSHLDRYARTLNCAEINSTFYRPHRAGTFARWAASTPADFRFAVKLAKSITHEAKLACGPAPIQSFLTQLTPLGEKLGPILIQLPPSLRFEDTPAAEFFEEFRGQFQGSLVLEPRHPSWFTGEAGELLRHHRIARVAADPARIPNATEPGGWPGLVYYRLHGAPRTYYSSYEPPFLNALALTITTANPSVQEAWVIFDNTALGHAFHNALDLRALQEQTTKMRTILG